MRPTFLTGQVRERVISHTSMVDFLPFAQRRTCTVPRNGVGVASGGAVEPILETPTGGGAVFVVRDAARGAG